jgi:large subunit ribosomal protein L25
VPVHFINEKTAPGVKTDGGVVMHHIADIEVTCLPENLPEFIEVDVANMNLGDTLHLSDLTLPKGVESVELGKGESHNQAVVSIVAPRVDKAAAADDEAAAPEAE